MLWKKTKNWIKKFEQPLILLIGSTSLTFSLFNLDFNFLEANLYDLRVSRGYQNSPDPNIVLITLDDATTKELNEFSPLTLDFHVQLLEVLEGNNPKAIGYLIDMNHVNQVNPEVFKAGWAARFHQTAKRIESKGTIFLLGTPFDVTGETLPPFPLNTLEHAVAVLHKDGNVFSEDKITRRALLTLDDKPAFHLLLAKQLGLIHQDELPSGNFYVSQVDGNYFFFRYHGSTVINPKKKSEFSYPRHSFIDVLNHRIPPGSLNQKIILVGTLSSDDSSDFAFTPYSKNSFTNPKLTIHANILDSVIHQNGIKRAPQLVNWIVTFVVTTSVLWWIMTSTPVYGVFATFFLSLAFILINQALFQIKNIWIRESQPLVGIFVAYYLTIPYRLIKEYKKRWEYQKKNNLLTQVEELKTNFLSLVTHDLKTPVARIQGLAEVLLRNTTERLLPKDKKTIHHIFMATEELNHFISSILELSQVESNALQIQLESKDLNQLIERTITGFQAQARARKIEIQYELEPLFPVKIDSSLISKVLNNLIDNAIKYSKIGSKIFIKSQEKNNKVEILIKDQGIGMTQEECKNLFTRFYRAKNDTTTTITGTGLGLYLTKYFIEAHHGTVEVESKKDQGSIFKIYLPIYATEEMIHV